MIEKLQDWWGTVDAWEVAFPWLLALATIIGGWLVGKLLAAIVGSFFKRRSEHIAAIGRRIAFYVVMIAAVFAALGQLGIQPGTLLTTAGLLTVAIGFAAQTSVANVISGIFLLIDRPFSINDTVKVDTTVGVVVAIDFLSSKIRTFDNLIVRIPNEALLKATIINYSLHSVRRIEQTISVSYDTELDDAIEVLSRALDDHPLILDEPEPFVLVDLLADSGITIIVRAWCIREDYVRARSALTIAMRNALRDAGIEIPFPQRVIHTLPAESKERTPPGPAL